MLETAKRTNVDRQPVFNCWSSSAFGWSQKWLFEQHLLHTCSRLPVWFVRTKYSIKQSLTVESVEEEDRRQHETFLSLFIGWIAWTEFPFSFHLNIWLIFFSCCSLAIVSKVADCKALDCLLIEYSISLFRSCYCKSTYHCVHLIHTFGGHFSISGTGTGRWHNHS